MKLETYKGKGEWGRMDVGGSDASMSMAFLFNFDIWKHVNVLNFNKLNQQGWD